MRKKIPAVVFLIVLLCLLSGCSGGKKDTVQTVKIGVTLYDQYDTFISEMMGWFTASATALEEETGTAINLEIVDAAGSQTTQASLAFSRIFLIRCGRRGSVQF